MILDTPQSFQPGKRNIQYLNKDFSQLKQSLIQFAQVYYPTTYRDFSDASPGMMFMEMAAYVGDILSFYIDYQFNESILVNAQERKNIIDAAKSLGYKPKVSTPSVTTLNVYQLVPSLQNSDGTFSPDLSYAQIIQPGMTTTSDTNVSFITDEPVDFTVDTQDDSLTISVYQRDSLGNPQFYVLMKSVSASAGTIVSKQVTIGTPTPFYSIQLSETNVLYVMDVVDADGNSWYETDYMAQDLVSVDTSNVFQNDTTLASYRDTVPMLMQFLRTARRFTVDVDENDNTYLNFGSGVNLQDDSMVVPSIATIGSPTSINGWNVPLDPSNFLTSKTFGQAPGNTTLTIRYVTGGGVASNVTANAIQTVGSAQYFGDITELSQTQQGIVTMIRNSIRVNNPVPATGGRDSETNTEIQSNALANFPTQNRAVTQQDYIVRSYAMPAKFGSIAKAYAVTDAQLDAAMTSPATSSIATSSSAPANLNASNQAPNNPFAINLYVLGYDSNQRLITTNPALQQNLINYLNQFRMLTDSVRILDGFIIDIGVEFSIIVYKNYNKRDVLSNCLNLVQSFFDINDTQFCQPINLARLKLEIGKVNGVQTVSSVKIKNLTAADGDYSPYAYNIDAATVNDIVYPSLDPSIFEVRFPTNDIVGKVM